MSNSNNNILLGIFSPLLSPNYLLNAVKNMHDTNSNCLMVYTGSPQTTLRINTNIMKINEMKKYVHDNNYDINNFCVHAPYIINIATDFKDKQDFAIKFLLSEIKRTHEFGFNKIILHPGNKLNIPLEQAINNAAYVINEINKINNDITICLETMSGKGTEIGSNLNELKSLIDKIENKKLIGVCLDTCHLHDAGYDLKEFDKFLDEFDQIIGIDKIKFIHINDSKNIVGSKKDRHEVIGEGKIGINTLKNIVCNSRIKNIPKVLETPYNDLINDYKEQINKLIK